MRGTIPFRFFHLILSTLCLFVGTGLSFSSLAADQSFEETYKQGSKKFIEYNGSDKNRKDGWSMMVQAAEGGCLTAKIDVGAYAAGFYTVGAAPGRVPFFYPDLILALRQLRDAAGLGNSQAMTQLALLYSSGVGEPRNDAESPQNLLLAAAKKGDKDAMLLLSERYLYGHGVTQDLLEASHWRHLGTKGSGGPDYFIDEEGNPRLQDSALLNEFAELVSLQFRAERKDPAALTKLEQLRSKQK